MGRRVKKRHTGIRIFAALLPMVVIAALVYIALGNHHMIEREYNDNSWIDTSYKITPEAIGERTTSLTPSVEPELSVSLSPDKLNSPYAILISLSEDTVLMEKNSEEKIYPASLTKMMTAIVAIENLPDLQEEIRLTDATFQGLYEADASMAGFQPGEQVRAIDLLFGVMLPSGAECCIGLADQIAGSEQNFVELMNQKAVELGMNNTHFENTTGLHNKNHYTTVKDLSVLLSYALQNDTYREIFTSSSHFITPTNKHPDGMTVSSTMFEELASQNIVGGEILGGKTGYTDEAGLCLASLAKVGSQEYILISAGANGNHHTEQYNIIDALTVYDTIGNDDKLEQTDVE
jgi:D-alanyl-D-alanine carboxypeptidase (penicillin-binding protein 5/6)